MKQKADTNVPEWHGCKTGDCPHDKQSECDATLAEYTNSDSPKCVNVGEDQAKDYWLTAASWAHSGYGPSYEIGIRAKDGGEFWLVQADWNERSVIKAMTTVRLMLDHGFCPTEVQAVLSA